jgi:hypothetical protein
MPTLRVERFMPTLRVERFMPTLRVERFMPTLRVESDGHYASKAVCAQRRERRALIKLTHYPQ